MVAQTINPFAYVGFTLKAQQVITGVSVVTIDIKELKSFLLENYPLAFVKSRKRYAVKQRHALIHIIRKHNNYFNKITVEAIGMLFGNYDHSTIVHACNVVNNWFGCYGYEDELKLYNEMEDSIKEKFNLI